MKKLFCTLLFCISLTSNASLIVCEVTNSLGNSFLSCTNKDVENRIKLNYRKAKEEKEKLQRQANNPRPAIINKRIFLIKELLNYQFEMKSETIFTLNI